MIRSVLASLSLLFVSTSFAADTTSVAPETTGPRLRAIRSVGYAARLPEGSLGVRAPRFFASPPPDTTAPATISLKTYRPLPMNDLFRPRRVELSRFDCSVKGLGAGLQMGLFAGLLAEEFGAFGSGRVPWYLAGAGAAAGALFGGTLGAENSHWNVGVQWDPDPLSNENGP